MVCTHCNKETAGPEYCGHCGRVLMVPCPECGEMEPIKRKHCLKRIRTGRTSLQEFRLTEKPAAFMSIRNTPIFIVTVLTSSITITVAFFSVLCVMHRVPDPPELFAFPVPDIGWATLGKWCALLASVTYWIVLRSDRIERDQDMWWSGASLDLFFTAHPEYWNIREELKDSKQEVKLRLPKL
jgi:hypothetical protein